MTLPYNPNVCQHEPHEDCLICRLCGVCREDLDSDDVCRACDGKNENEEE